MIILSEWPLLGCVHAVMHAAEFLGLHGLAFLLTRSVVQTIGKVLVTNRRLSPYKMCPSPLNFQGVVPNVASTTKAG